MVSTFYHGCFSPASLNSQRNEALRRVPGERPFWAGHFPHVPEQEPSVDAQTDFPWEASESWGSHPALLSLPPCGFQRRLVSSNSHWNVASGLWQWIVFLTERILICSATPHFSPRSSLTILMRVFFQETHISLFDLGASVRIFLILLWHSESVNVFHICLMLFRDIYDHLLVTRGKACRNFF